MIARVLLVLGGLTVLYAGAYVGLSLYGGYAPASTGNARFAGGGPTVADVSVWRARFVQLRIFLNERGEVTREANFLGWLFYPLELGDRQYWHPTRHPLLDLLQSLPFAGSPPLTPTPRAE